MVEAVKDPVVKEDAVMVEFTASVFAVKLDP